MGTLSQCADGGPGVVFTLKMRLVSEANYSKISGKSKDSHIAGTPGLPLWSVWFRNTLASHQRRASVARRPPNGLRDRVRSNRTGLSTRASLRLQIAALGDQL